MIGSALATILVPSSPVAKPSGVLAYRVDRGVG